MICYWKFTQNTIDGRNPAKQLIGSSSHYLRVFHIPGGAGFLSSTVSRSITFVSLRSLVFEDVSTSSISSIFASLGVKLFKMTFVRLWEISRSTLPETNIAPETFRLEGRCYVILGESNWSPFSFKSDTLLNFVLQAKDMTYLSMGNTTYVGCGPLPGNIHKQDVYMFSRGSLSTFM